ncbi:MAG: radical SAM protein [Pseudomonadota bacterium]|nr:radical SAM protein [Pseudomonadota bacterium]
MGTATTSEARLTLIHPPVSKPCEPPAGIARLAGYLGARGVVCDLIDANVEGLAFLLQRAIRGEVDAGVGLRGAGSRIGPGGADRREYPPGRGGSAPVAAGGPGRARPPGEAGEGWDATNRDAWTWRALRNLERHLRALRSPLIYSHPDRYRRAVADLGRILARLPHRRRVVLGLADYQDGELSPVRSEDLLAAAACPGRNPFYPYFVEGLAPRLVAGAPPPVIGLSLNYLSQALCAFALIGFLRGRYPQARIVLGGGLVTSWRRRPEALGALYGVADFLVAGPGEDFLLELAKNRGSVKSDDDRRDGGEMLALETSPDERGKPLAPSLQIAAPDAPAVHEARATLAVAARQGVFASREAPASRERRPKNGPAPGRVRPSQAGSWPGRSGVEEPPEVVPSCPDYRAFPGALYLAPGRILPYSAAAGCWWRRCRFCPETAERNPYRPLPTERVFADLERLTREMNPVLIHFLDNAMSPALLAALAQHPVGVPWYGFARITEQLATPEFCRRLRDGGCVMLKLGLESGDQRVLDALDKGIDLTTASRALWSMKEAGIAAYVYLLFGTPAEDREAARRTVEFVAAHGAAIEFLNIALFNMPAFAAAASGLTTRPFSPGDLSLYVDFDHPRGWSRGEVRRFLAGEARRHPAIAAILRRTPPVFTSNHAPFTALGGGLISRRS